MPFRTDVVTTGVAPFLAGLRAISGKQLEQAVGKELSKSAAQVLAPAIRAQLSADISRKGSHRGPPGKVGRRGPLEKKVTARKIRTRGHEMVAYSVGPRAWWKHFFIQGTRAHAIVARGIGGQATSRQVRQINRGATGAQALYLNGLFATRVQHPGSQGHDSVGKAGANKAGLVTKNLSDRLMAEYRRGYATQRGK